MIFNLLQQMQALGISLPEILSQLGVEKDKDGKFSLSGNGETEKNVSPKEPSSTPVKNESVVSETRERIGGDVNKES